ncbi:hypothetical protein LV83_00754 [Algoriphagus yeomjeoni]|uniref:Uncharacterized protein n=2 Tax=Algoriphagus yeomjeoni TaxID=291403 RepID=A0A327PNS6_9BACT|nr:hypothetical protein LV83_00754 [Algoriphagus yeomjeoni]
MSGMSLRGLKRVRRPLLMRGRLGGGWRLWRRGIKDKLLMGNNAIVFCQSDYLRSSRTIETVILSKGTRERALFIYNYEGYSFRVFEDILALILFFETGVDRSIHFDSEVGLDGFLERVSI